MSSYIQFMGALLFVLALMGGLWLFLKRMGFSGPVTPAGTVRRLRVVETMPLSAQHRAVLIERDTIQHLVIIGPGGETVVESGITKP